MLGKRHWHRWARFKKKSDFSLLTLSFFLNRETSEVTSLEKTPFTREQTFRMGIKTNQGQWHWEVILLCTLHNWEADILFADLLVTSTYCEDLLSPASSLNSISDSPRDSDSQNYSFLKKNNLIHQCKSKTNQHSRVYYSSWKFDNLYLILFEVRKYEITPILLIKIFITLD